MSSTFAIWVIRSQDIIIFIIGFSGANHRSLFLLWKWLCNIPRYGFNLYYLTYREIFVQWWNAFQNFTSCEVTLKTGADGGACSMWQSHNASCNSCADVLVCLVISHTAASSLKPWDFAHQLYNSHKTPWDVAEALKLSHCLVACATQLPSELCDECTVLRQTRNFSLDTKEGHYVQTHNAK